MELKASSVKTDGLSPSDCTSNPEEIEFSDEDDDDRNHKHRRRENHTQSSERDSMEPVFTRSYRNHNKQFDNSHPFRENGSRAGETWKNYNTNSQDKNFTTKFDKRRLGSTPSTRVHLDTNQRIRPNQTFAVETGMGGRGRGRGSGRWDYFDSRINSVDLASQMVPPSVAPGLFSGRSLPNISSTPNASWSAFGLIPGMPNGGLEPLHDLQGTLRPPINSSLNMGIPRQRCRDFEELGYCLRGDMCPMEHGVNRIVVEDVQSLSQFNLPVSLPSAQLVGTHVGTGPFMSVGAPSTSFMNNKGINSKNNKLGGDDRVGNGVCSGSGDGAELYDPDQPLWNSNAPETSNALLELQSHSNDETDTLMAADPFGSHHVKLHASSSRGHNVRSTGTVAGSQTTGVCVAGGTDGSKNRLLMKEKIGSPLNSSDYFEGDRDALIKSQSKSHQQKQLINDDAGPKSIESTKTPGVQLRTIRKPSQKALRTLFVNGIPHNSNKKEDLLSHFSKFGTVIDIYIPANSERAFVQFSKREEAEAALKAPDAVMGNRFIKLLWANRDSISDDGSRTSSTFLSGTAFVLPPHSSTTTKSKDNAASVGPKGISVPPVVVESAGPKWPSSNQSKPVNISSPKVPPSQKKLENLEQMKEELRKKQELLEQKRNDFRRQLEKLAKQTAGTEPAAKRHKSRIAVDGVKANAEPGFGVSDQDTEMTVNKNVAVDNVLESSSNSKALEESSTSKQLIRSSMLDPSLMNSNKLNDGPSTFRILSPLPAGLANVAALTEHFSPYGDLLSVEVEDFGSDKDDGEECKKPKNSVALVNFVTYHSAKNAYENAKLWQGNSLQFMWVAPIPPSNDTNDSREICSSDPNHCADDMDVQYGEILASKNTQEAPANEGREHKKSESNGVKHENIHPSRSPTLTDEELRKDEPSVSGEDASKCASSQLTASEEKGSPEENDC